MSNKSPVRETDLATEGAPTSPDGVRAWVIDALRSEYRKGLATFGPVALLLTVVYMLPFFLLFLYSINQFQEVPMERFAFTINHYVAFLTPDALLSFNWENATYVKLLLKSLRVSLVVTFICLIISYPITYYVGQKAPQRYKTSLIMLVIIPFWTSYLIRTYAWVPILSQNGIINTTLSTLGLPKLQLLYTGLATTVGLVYVYIPFMILPLYASMNGLDNSLIEAAQDMGATRVDVFKEVIFPLTLPGAAAGSLFIFIKCAAAFITPTLLGGSNGILYANVIVSQFRELFNWNLGAALSFILLVVVLFLLWLGSRLGLNVSSRSMG
ncbi:ABC transporter permease [Natribaculum luteum]|uniref:ABC transporter permease n=1 Tax=Natribaculum luteum TaxID=1586232 RepID=A0ABD5NV67_9EURY|nr:ABC transporter permease [Natribaculum luteum]